MSGEDMFKRLAALQAEVEALSHAIQTGVKFDQELGSNDGHPKHLRTGVNLAMCQHAALVDVLVKKGLLTDEEYWSSQVDQLKREVADYERRLAQKTGVKITLA